MSVVKEKFSFKNLSPSIGDLCRLPVGTASFYEVPDFKVAGNLQTFAVGAGGRVATTSMYYFDAKSPEGIGKLLRVEVVETANKRQRARKAQGVREEKIVD